MRRTKQTLVVKLCTDEETNCWVNRSSFGEIEFLYVSTCGVYPG
jgi:hypothetical protein